MKKLFLSTLFLLGIVLAVSGADLNSEKWGRICTGSMGADWYGSDEAKTVADNLIEVQRSNGGWMKNYEYHKLTASERNTLLAEKGEHSCFDNTSTTQEMRFLAKVWQKTKVEKYREAFLKAFNLIFEAEKPVGGWGQYWPLSGGGSYQDYITFNDDLVTNMLKILRDINANTGDFKDIVTEAQRAQAKASFDKGIDMIIKCQYDDNGVKSAWCAQHDPEDLLPAVGRPHEHPSISGCESAALVSFLMTIPDPSPELQECITSAITWLDSHKIEGKAVEDVKEGSTTVDRRIVDKAGSNLWGRFIQLGGENGKKVYDKFFKMLEDRGKKRSYTTGGKTYTYTEAEIARTSYRADKAYQPIYAIYSNDYAHLFYRFLYNYADTDPVVDEMGCPVATSLMADNRKSYQYVGSWPQKVIENEYPAWKQALDVKNQAGEATPYTINAATHTDDADGVWSFENGFTITSSKGYATGKENTIKFSRNVKFTVGLPEGLKAVKVAFTGYDNYADVDAYIAELNGTNFGETDYVLPKKDESGNYQTVTHTIELAAPAEGSFTFTPRGQQVCLQLTVFCVDAKADIDDVIADEAEQTSGKAIKRYENGQIVIIKDGKVFNVSGQRIR